LSSLDKTCQSFDPRRDIGSEKFERGDCGNRYEGGGDGSSPVSSLKKFINMIQSSLTRILEPVGNAVTTKTAICRCRFGSKASINY
jgi:hypothetical protein